jgi:hypothetical protein
MMKLIIIAAMTIGAMSAANAHPGWYGGGGWHGGGHWGHPGGYYGGWRPHHRGWRDGGYAPGYGVPICYDPWGRPVTCDID